MRFSYSFQNHGPNLWPLSRLAWLASPFLPFRATQPVGQSSLRAAQARLSGQLEPESRLSSSWRRDQAGAFVPKRKSTES
jgi:hypothetical protein